MRYDIKVRLLRLSKTQRWLWQEVKKRSYPSLTEGMFSSILSGNYTAGYADNVAEIADEILTELEVPMSRRC